MAYAKFEGNRLRIYGEIAENHAILVNLTASIVFVIWRNQINWWVFFWTRPKRLGYHFLMFLYHKHTINFRVISLFFKEMPIYDILKLTF